MASVKDEGPVKDPVETWQDLMHKWDAAYASYRAALEAYGALSDLPGLAEEHAEAKALAELTEIKLRIDRLIADSARRRSPVTDSIVVARLHRGSSDLASKSDKTDPVQPASKDPKLKKR